jgi:hypothetical protein
MLTGSAMLSTLKSGSTSGERGRPRGRAEAPKFPGCVFWRFDSNIKQLVLTTPSGIRIVAFENVPVQISDHEMDAVRAVAHSSFPAAPYPYVRIRRTIRIRRGPLQGVEGQIVGSGSKNLLVVSIHLLQRSVAVELAPEVLDAVDSPPRPEELVAS